LSRGRWVTRAAGGDTWGNETSSVDLRTKQELRGRKKRGSGKGGLYVRKEKTTGTVCGKTGGKKKGQRKSRPIASLTEN